MARYSRPFLTWMWSQGRTSSTGRVALAVEGDVDPQVLEGRPPERGVEVLGPGVEPGPPSPGLFQGEGDAAIAPRQDAFEQALLDVVALDLDRPDPDPRAQVFVRPAEVVAVLHAVPLVGRVRLGDEVGDAGDDLGVAAGHVLADPGDRLGHLDDAVEVGGPLAGEAAHEVELDLPPAAPEGLGGAVVEVLVVDRLADLLAHVVAGDLGGQGQPAAPPLGQQRGDLLEHLGDPQARERDLDPQRA